MFNGDLKKFNSVNFIMDKWGKDLVWAGLGIGTNLTTGCAWTRNEGVLALEA